jgi:hypothetical protein
MLAASLGLSGLNHGPAGIWPGRPRDQTQEIWPPAQTVIAREIESLWPKSWSVRHLASRRGASVGGFQHGSVGTRTDTPCAHCAKWPLAPRKWPKCRRAKSLRPRGQVLITNFENELLAPRDEHLASRVHLNDPYASSANFAHPRQIRQQPNQRARTCYTYRQRKQGPSLTPRVGVQQNRAPSSWGFSTLRGARSACARYIPDWTR